MLLYYNNVFFALGINLAIPWICMYILISNKYDGLDAHYGISDCGCLFCLDRYKYHTHSLFF